MVVFAGQVHSGHFNADGSATLQGFEYGWDNVAKRGYTGCNFTVILYPGGPGKGRFNFRDCVFGPGQYDTEVVRFGLISVNH